LMIDADPTLSNDPDLMTDPLNRMDDFKRILTSTATRMPGREDYEVGAGYINTYAAVDKVLNRSKEYGSFVNPTFNAGISNTAESEPFSVAFNPAATPGPDSPNTKKFNVAAGTDVIDVFANVRFQGQTNPVGVLLHAPNGTTYSSGVGLPVLNAPTRQVVVKNPQPGQWTLEVRGVRGLTTSGVSTPLLPTAGVAPPSTVTGTIIKKDVSISPMITDIDGHEAQSEIELALISRRIDSFADGSFRPNDEVTREDFARSLALNVPLRQSLGTTPKFADVTSGFAPLAEAITSEGSTLRDFYTAESSSASDGLMSADGSFNPGGTVSRLDLAVAFVRALGLDAEARAKANTPVVDPTSGQPIIENSEIPGNLRGYVQIAIDKGFLEVYQASVEQTPNGFVARPGPRVEPNASVTRASLAAKLNLFAQRFVAGN
jgi:serine protease AprX